MITKDKISAVVSDISKEPLHRQSISDALMKSYIDKLYGVLNSDEFIDLQRAGVDGFTKIQKVNDFVQNNVVLSDKYNNAYKEAQARNVSFIEHYADKLKYRTGAAALCEGQAICTGFAELTRTMLKCLDVDSETKLALTPDPRKNASLPYKPFFHYVVIAHLTDALGKDVSIIVDPEREHKKGEKFSDYMNYVMAIYGPPPECTSDMVGESGLGTAYTEIEELKAAPIKSFGAVIKDIERIVKNEVSRAENSEEPRISIGSRLLDDENVFGDDNGYIADDGAESIPAKEPDIDR